MGNTVMGSSAMQHRDFLMVLIKRLNSQSNGHPPRPPPTISKRQCFSDGVIQIVLNGKCFEEVIFRNINIPSADRMVRMTQPV